MLPLRSEVHAKVRSAPSLYCWYVWNWNLIHTIIAPSCLRFGSCNTTGQCAGVWGVARRVARAAGIIPPAGSFCQAGLRLQPLWSRIGKHILTDKAGSGVVGSFFERSLNFRLFKIYDFSLNEFIYFAIFIFMCQPYPWLKSYLDTLLNGFWCKLEKLALWR